MIKGLMIPMQPQQVLDVIEGKKKLDLRTWIPKGYVGWVYVYCTKSEVLEKSFLGYRVLPINAYYSHGIGISISGSVVARFWFDEYDTLEYIHQWGGSDYVGNDGINSWNVDSSYLDNLCLDYQDVLDYGFREKPFHHQKDLYAWHIKKLEIFDTPKELSEFYKKIDGLDENGGFILDNLKDGEYVTIPELKKKYLLSKAPQKFCYCYVKDKE